MSGLSSELHHRCRSTFMRCDAFESAKSLRYIFTIDALYPFRFGLPTEGSIAELVNGCISYLIDRQIGNNQPALYVFINELRNSISEDEVLKHDLDELANAVQFELVGPKIIPASSNQRPQVVFDLILKIDYLEQVKIVRKAINMHRTTAFLVQGEPDCGQRLLVNRIVRLLPGWQTAQRVDIDVSSNGVGYSSDALWRQLARRMHIPTGTPPTQICLKLGQWRKTQDVIIIFNTVDYTECVNGFETKARMRLM